MSQTPRSATPTAWPAARMVARLESATGVSALTTDTDTVFEAIIDWQAAGGSFKLPEENRLWDRAIRALGGFGYGADAYSLLIKCLGGKRTLTQKDRLSFATAEAWGVQNAAVDEVMVDVSDGELIREWSNLPVLGKQLEAATDQDERVAVASAFVPDLDDEVAGWLAERSDSVADIGKLRERLVAALGSAAGAAIASSEFGYAPDARALAATRDRQASDVEEKSRGLTPLNAISHTLIDPFTSTDESVDQEFGEYEGATVAVAATDRGSTEESRALSSAEVERTEFLDADEAYEAVRESTAKIGAVIASALSSLLFTLATGGVASPVAAALVGGLMSTTLGEMTRAFLAGRADFDAGAKELTKSLVGSLTAIPLGAVSSALIGAAGSTSVAKEIIIAIEKAAPGVGKTLVPQLAKSGLEAAVKDFPVEYLKQAASTEGLLRQGFDGALPIVQSTMQDFGIKICTQAVKYKVGPDVAKLADAGKWDEHTAALAQTEVLDVVLTAAAQRVIDGDDLDAGDYVKLLGKVVTGGVKGGRTSAKAEESASRILEFFNLTDANGIATAIGGDSRFAASVILTRERDGDFGTLAELKAIPKFDSAVMVPAATKALDDFERLRTAAGQDGT